MFLKCIINTGDNTEKECVHQFLAKPKMIASGGLRGAVSLPGGPGQCLGEGMHVKPPNNFVFFHIKKHIKTVNVRMNIG